MDELLAYLTTDVERKGQAALAIAQKAETEGRSMSDAEKLEADRLLAEAQSTKNRIEELQKQRDLKDQIGKLTGALVAPASTKPADARTVGEAFTSSDAYKALIANGIKGEWRTGAIDIDGRFDTMGRKLTDGDTPSSTVVSITGGGGTLPLNPQIVPGGPISPTYENPLVMAALFGQGTVTANTIVWLEETNTQAGTLSDPGKRNMYSDSDAAVATTSEGQNKPAAFVDFTKRSKSLTKIAAFLPISDEMMEDESQIASYINGRLSVFVRQAEDAFLIDELLASGVGSAAGSQLGGSNNWFDAIAVGIMKCQRDGGQDPDAVVMNPLDFWTMATAKASTAGTYFADPFSAAMRAPWGLRTVVTNGVNTGTAIVGAFREGATLWRKGGLSVEASNSHNDYFRKNIIALRAEERLALTVYRPLAFCTVVR